MADRPAKRGECRSRCIVVCAVLLTLAGPAAPAQTCDAAPTAAGADVVSNDGAKFRLIARQCPLLAEPARVQRAAQLDLYDREHAVVIAMPATAVPPAATAPVGPLAPTTPPDRDAARVLSLAPALTAVAREHQIDPLLLHAIAHVESRHRPNAVSPAGARGVMQVMPATARRFGVDSADSLFDAETNLRASAALLRTLRARYGDDLRLVLAAYNAGEGAVAKHGGNVPPYPETQAYVRDVLAVHKRLGEAFAVSPSGALVARGEPS